MSLRDSVARSVRQHKEKRPELYCAYPKCLWRLSSGPCPKHRIVASPFVGSEAAAILMTPPSQEEMQSRINANEARAAKAGL